MIGTVLLLESAVRRSWQTTEREVEGTNMTLILNLNGESPTGKLKSQYLSQEERNPLRGLGILNILWDTSTHGDC